MTNHQSPSDKDKEAEERRKKAEGLKVGSTSFFLLFVLCYFYLYIYIFLVSIDLIQFNGFLPTSSAVLTAHRAYVQFLMVPGSVYHHRVRMKTIQGNISSIYIVAVTAL